MELSPQPTLCTLNKFDLSVVKSNHTVAIMGRRDTGKTFMARHWLQQMNDIYRGDVICMEEGNEMYQSTSMQIHNQYSPQLIQEILSRQETFISQYEDNMKVDTRAALILDNCLYSTASYQEPLLQELIINNEHYHVTTIVTLQYPLSISPTLRSNIDYIVIFQEPELSNRKRLYDYYAGIFPTFDQFCQVLDQYTSSPYSCIVIDNCSTYKGDIRDKVFWYRAE